MEDVLNYMKTNNISCRLNNDLTENFNTNYDILHENMKTAKAIYFPVKYVKFNKYRHKQSKWITSGILRSIKLRDTMYVLFKGCPPNSSQHFAPKNNLPVLNSILKRTTREAKINNFGNLFHQYKSDIKMTWKTISQIICKSSSKRKELEKIIVNSKVISN